jgi:hypothetical protein
MCGGREEVRKEDVSFFHFLLCVTTYKNTSFWDWRGANEVRNVKYQLGLERGGCLTPPHSPWWNV